MKSLFLFGIILVSSYTLLAQDEDTTAIYYAKTIRVTAEKYVRIPEVNEIAAKMFLPLHKTPISVGIVTNKVLKEQNAHVLSDALQNISSINVQTGLGTHDFFLIRGFVSTSGGLVLIDGADEPDVSLFRIFGYGFYNLYNIDQVEVLKGPAAFLYGGNTLSGAVNLVRKMPLFKNFRDISVSYGKYKSYRATVDAGFTHPDNRYAFRLNSLWQDSGHYRSHYHKKSYAFNPTFTWNLDKQSSLTINLEYVYSDINPDIGIPLYFFEESWQLPDVALTTSYQTPFDNLSQHIFRTRLDYRRKVNKSLKLRNKFYFTYLDGNCKLTLAHIPYKGISGGWILDRHMYLFNELQKFVGNQFEVLLSYKTGAIKHNLLVGLEAAKISNSSIKGTTMLNTLLLFNSVDTVSNYNQLLSIQVKAETNATNLIFAPYFVDYITFSEKLQLLCGGRFDFIDFSTDRQNVPFDYIARSIRSEPIPFSQNYVKFSPMIGLVVKDSNNLWFYANAGKSFAQGVRVIDEPQYSTQFEIGYKFKTQNDKVRTSAAIYSIIKENMSIPLQGPLQGDAHSPIGSQRSRGLEFELTAQPLQNWLLFITYAYIEAELINYKAMTTTEYLKTTLEDYSGNIPEFVPAQILNIWTTKEFYNGLGFGFGIHYTGKQYVNIDNDFELDGYATYNAMLFYRLRNWNLRINFQNLTNRKYLTRGLGAYSVIPTNPLTFSGSIDVSF